jgi:hypothetical protein
MQLGYIEVSGIRRIVEDRKVVWERYPDRWVKFVDKKHEGKKKPDRRAITGKSEAEMHEYLDDKIFDTTIKLVDGERTPCRKNRVWVHGDVINVVRCR